MHLHGTFLICRYCYYVFVISVISIQSSLCHSRKYKINCKIKILYLQKIFIIFLNSEGRKSKTCHWKFVFNTSTFFSCFDLQKSSFHTIADNSNEFLRFDGLPNVLYRRCRALQNQLTLAEIFPENKALLHKSCIVISNKQKLSRKQK